jgi:hypothetical protein
MHERRALCPQLRRAKIRRSAFQKRTGSLPGTATPIRRQQPIRHKAERDSMSRALRRELAGHAASILTKGLTSRHLARLSIHRHLRRCSPDLGRTFMNPQQSDLAPLQIARALALHLSPKRRSSM